MQSDSNGYRVFMAVEQIDQWLGEIDYPMYIVTAAANGERAGCLVGFTTQCSMEPVRFLVCLSDQNRTYRIAQDADHLGVHLVPADAERLARLFGSETGDDVDKFADCALDPGHGQVPILADCPNWFVGRVLDRLTLGDHMGFLLEPVDSGAGGSDTQFDFHRAKRLDPGHDA
jgi:flavin reductase (DIM6/NTAB) family NADH-FMN oxidoreductase RutF